MPRKNKPNRGWKDSSTYSSHQLAKEDFKKIATVLGISAIPKSEESRLQEAIQLYFADKKSIPDKPRPAEIKAGILKLQKAARSVIECYKNLDKFSKQLLARTEAASSIKYFYRDQCLSDARIIDSAASQVLQDFNPNTGGSRRKKSALNRSTGSRFGRTGFSMKSGPQGWRSP